MSRQFVSFQVLPDDIRIVWIAKSYFAVPREVDEFAYSGDRGLVCFTRVVCQVGLADGE